MSMIFKKHLSRRTFVRGMGVTLGLPFLDAMVPARTALAQTAARPQVRLGLCFIPHGAVMSQWTPATTGALELSPILSPLAAHKDQVVVLSNLGGFGGTSGVAPIWGFTALPYPAGFLLLIVGTVLLQRQLWGRTAARTGT